MISCGPKLYVRKAYVHSPNVQKRRVLSPYVHRLGDWKGQVEDCNTAIQLDPKYAVASNNRGHAKGQLGDWKGKLEDGNTAIQLDPKCAVAFQNRGDAKGKLGDWKVETQHDPWFKWKNEAKWNMADGIRHSEVLAAFRSNCAEVERQEEVHHG